MMKFREIVFLLLCLVPVVSMATTDSEVYDDYKKGLMWQFENLKEQAGTIDRGRIYTRKLINETWYYPQNNEL